MSKENQIKTEIMDQLVLVYDPILGSRYELQSVEVVVEESIDIVSVLTETLSSELDKSIKNEG